MSGVLLAIALAACGGGGTVETPAPAATINAPAASSTNTSTSTSNAGTVAISSVSAPVLAQADATLSNGNTTFSFELPQDRTTSAAVYTEDGTLVRTLWRGEPLPRGITTRTWDGLDDSGQRLPAARYTVRLLHHDVRHVWEGVVGNSSDRSGGATPHRSMFGVASLAAVPGGMVFAVGYNEAQSSLMGFTLAAPQRSRVAMPQQDPFSAAGHIATDGRRLYWTNVGGLARRSFVAARDIATGAAVRLIAGSDVCLNPKADGSCWLAQDHRGVIEARNDLASPPGGIAVQAEGRLLAVAYPADRELRLYDKADGRWLRSLPADLRPGATQPIAFAPGGDLWVITVTGPVRYTGLEGSPSVAARIEGTESPLAITVDGTDDDVVWLAEGGTRQQVRRFGQAGDLRATFGQAGGCRLDNAVRDDRLCLGAFGYDDRSTLAVDERGRVWVADSANQRLLALTRAATVAERIAFLPTSYVSTVDPGAPTRVFSNFLEFEIDYSRDLASGWRLVRNWLPALPPALRDDNLAQRPWAGWRSVHTLSNGRTYATTAVSGRTWLVELRSSGEVRLIGPMRSATPAETAPFIHDNGDLGWSSTANDEQRVLRAPLNGFDADGNPRWSTTPLTLARAPLTEGTPWYRAGSFTGVNPPRFAQTAAGDVVFFDPSVEANHGMHLGAVAAGGSRWRWLASPSGPLDGRGSFQTRRSDSGLQYGGNAVMVQGRSIVYGYHGEFYTDLGNRRQGQANQFMHFRDDGLFIGQFGVASTRALGPADPGLSGNAFSPTLVRAAGRVYLYHNDESTHGGVHRWRLDGLDDMTELSGSGSPGSNITLR